jgi:hypothetical protein
MREFLHEMNDIFDKYDVMTVGELPNTPKKSDVLRYISAKERQLNTVFNFDTVALGQTKGARFATTPYGPADFKREISKWQTAIEGTDAWTTAFLENHDQGKDCCTIQLLVVSCASLNHRSMYLAICIRSAQASGQRWQTVCHDPRHHDWHTFPLPGSRNWHD